jgi:hypothetical protein
VNKNDKYLLRLLEASSQRPWLFSQWQRQYSNPRRRRSRWYNESLTLLRMDWDEWRNAMRKSDAKP